MGGAHCETKNEKHDSQPTQSTKPARPLGLHFASLARGACRGALGSRPMSYAIRIFSAEQFSETRHRGFIAEMQNLFGEWRVAESTPFSSPGWTIHECCITSEDDVPNDEWVHVWVAAHRRVKGEKPMWPFEYEWYINFETGSGRSVLGLAVQLGAVVLAMQRLPWFLVEDRDSFLGDGEPTEFRSHEAVLAHIRLVLTQNPERLDWLRQRGLLDQDGSLLVPSKK